MKENEEGQDVISEGVWETEEKGGSDGVLEENLSCLKEVLLKLRLYVGVRLSIKERSFCEFRCEHDCYSS